MDLMAEPGSPHPCLEHVSLIPVSLRMSRSTAGLEGPNAGGRPGDLSDTWRSVRSSHSRRQSLAARNGSSLRSSPRWQRPPPEKTTTRGLPQAKRRDHSAAAALAVDPANEDLAGEDEVLGLGVDGPEL